MHKLILAMAFFAASAVHGEAVNYDPIKTQVAIQTADCMYDWMQGSLNHGARDRTEMVNSAVNMCAGMALKFGWTKPQMTELASRVFVTIPGVTRK